jgi:hypothetical protein
VIGERTRNREGDDRLFEGEEAVLHVIERIVAPLGLPVDATSPWWTRDFRTAIECRPASHSRSDGVKGEITLDVRSVSSVHHAVEPPTRGRPSTHDAAILEHEAGACDKVLNGRRTISRMRARAAALAA